MRLEKVKSNEQIDTTLLKLATEELLHHTCLCLREHLKV